jgi:hypothetical protein
VSGSEGRSVDAAAGACGDGAPVGNDLVLSLGERSSEEEGSEQ